MGSENRPISRRKLVKQGLTLGALALVGDVFALEPEWIKVERVDIPIKGLPASFDGYRISLFSDIHWPRHIQKGYLDRVVRLANDFRPDLVAVPGDFCDANKLPLRQLNHISLAGLYDGLRAKDGCVATLGNHDHRFNVPNLRREMAESTPFKLLTNEHRLIRRGGDLLAIGGVDDLWNSVVDPVKTFAEVPDDVPRILLSHNPDVAEDHVWPTRIDLQLSGHTHGGEIHLPFGQTKWIPSKYGNKFREGLVQGRSHRVYVTRGVCSPRGMRFRCRPEVTYITLRAS